MYNICGVPMMQYATSDQKHGHQWIGKSTITTHQCTCLSLRYISQSETKLHKCSNLHIPPTVHHVTFVYSFPKIKLHLKGRFDDLEIIK
jgi:hydroxyacyl-ACP dehydratase HTD2-like protein with hotdog domain